MILDQQPCVAGPRWQDGSSALNVSAVMSALLLEGAERPAYTGREIGYPAIVPSLAVTGCSSIN